FCRCPCRAPSKSAPAPRSASRRYVGGETGACSLAYLSDQVPKGLRQRRTKTELHRQLVGGGVEKLNQIGVQREVLGLYVRPFGQRLASAFHAKISGVRVTTQRT